MSPAPQLESCLQRFVDAAKSAFAGDLRSVVLFGSAAEDRWRVTSDVNVLVVLARFDAARAAALGDAARFARTAVRLSPMFVLESELADAMDAFAVKFADILRRRRVLHGADPFAGAAVSHEATRRRLGQAILNLAIRLRAACVSAGGDDARLALAVAGAAGPLRAIAAAILELEGASFASSAEALEKVAASTGVPGAADLLARVSRARREGSLPDGEAGATLAELAALAEALRRRAAAIAPPEAIAR